MTTLGIVSDTHGHVHYALEAVRMLESLGVDEVLHCGDIGSTDIVELFSAWPTHFVFGNVDFEKAQLRAAIEAAGQTCHGERGILEREEKKIAFLHGHDTLLFRETLRSGEFDLLCYGHTHQAKQETVGHTLVLNPGALFRATPHSLAVVELPECKVTEVPL